MTRLLETEISMERPASQYVITCDQIDHKIVIDSEFLMILFSCRHVLIVDIYTCEIPEVGRLFSR